jgi:hypothetical protein
MGPTVGDIQERSVPGQGGRKFAGFGPAEVIRTAFKTWRFARLSCSGALQPTQAEIIQ